MLMAFLELTLAIPSPPFQVQIDIALPPGLGLVYEIFNIDRNTVLAATLSAKLLINITESRVIKQWDEADTYQIHRPFFDLLYFHGQYFQFKKLSSQGVTTVQYMWWTITESNFLPIPNLVTYYQACCYLTKMTGGISTLTMLATGTTYAGDFYDMHHNLAPNNFVILTTNNGLYVYLKTSLDNSNTLFVSRYNGVYTKFKFLYNGIYRFIGNRVDGAVVFGNVVHYAESVFLTPNNFANVFPGAKLLGLDFSSWYFLQGSYLVNKDVTVVTNFNVSLGYQIYSAAEITDFFDQQFLALGLNNAIRLIGSCFLMCASCTGFKQYECSSCQSTYTHNGNTCSNSSCSLSHYSYGGGNCISCLPSATKCGYIRSSNRIVHYTCASGYYLFLDLCVSTCPFHNQMVGSHCVWKNCPPGQNKMPGNICMECPSGTYIQITDGTCVACAGLCITCSAPAYCLTCQSPYLALTGSCVTICPPLFEGDLSQGACVACPHFYYSIGTRCVDNCLPTDYPDIQGFCLSCIAPCISCTGPSYCLSCSGLLSQQGVCRPRCTGRFYQVAMECVVCTALLLSATQQCLINCPVGYYADTGASLCVSCSPPCAACSSPTVCTGCSGRFLHFNTCVNPCPASFYGDSLTNTCRACRVTCLRCTGPGDCQQCENALLLYNDRCLVSCPAEHFSNYTHCMPCSSYCVRLSYQWLSKAKQPYSNLRIALNLSRPVSYPTLIGSLSFTHSSNVAFSNLTEIESRSFVLEFGPASPQFSITNQPVTVQLLDNGARAINNYVFDRSAFQPVRYNFNYMPTRNSGTAKLTLALVDLNTEVYRWPIHARCALNFVLLDQNSLLAVKSSINLPKHYVLLQNLLHSGNLEQPRDWLFSQNSTKGRMLLSSLAYQKLIFRGTVLVSLGAALLMLAAIQALKWKGLLSRNNVGMHWALSDFIHRITAVLLLMDITAAGLKMPDYAIQLALVGYIYCYFLYRLRRYIKLTGTLFYCQQFQSLFKEFEFQLATFKYVPRVDLTFPRFLSATFLGPLYFYSCLLLYFVKATFFLNLSDQPPLLMASVIVVSLFHFIGLVLRRPFLEPRHNIAAVIVLVIQLLLQIIWLVLGQLYKQPESNSSLTFQLLGWVCLCLTTVRVLVQIVFMAFLIFAYLVQLRKGYLNHCNRVRLYCQEQAAQKDKHKDILNN